MKLNNLVLIFGLLSVLALAGCIGEKAESKVNIQTVKLYGPTEDNDYNISVTLPDSFYIDSDTEPIAEGSTTLSGFKILNKNQTGTMGIILIGMNEAKRSVFLLDDLSKFVDKMVGDKGDLIETTDKKILGRDGREWRYWVRLTTGTAPVDTWIFGIPLDDKSILLVSSPFPRNVTDEILNSMQIVHITSNQ